MLKTKGLNVAKFWCQLTVWCDNVIDLCKEVAWLDDKSEGYGKYFIVKRSPCKTKYAIFTIGENYGEDEVMPLGIDKSTDL